MIGNINIFRLKNISWYLAASLISSAIGLLFNPFLAKNLSTLDYSIIGYYTSFGALFTPILNFSVVSFYVRKYFKIAEPQRQNVCNTVLTVLMIWGVCSSALVLLVFYFYCLSKDLPFPFTPFAYLTVLQLFFNNIFLVYQVNLRMNRRARLFFNITLVNALIGLALSVLLVIILNFGATGRLFALFVASMFVSVLTLKKMNYHFNWDIGIIKEAITFGWPVSLSSIIQYFLVGVDMSLVANLDDTNTMGLYVVGMSIGLHISAFSTALSQTFEPDIYQAIANYDFLKVAKVISLSVTILVFISIIFCLFSTPIMYVLTYNRYTNAASFACIAAFSVVSTYLLSSTKCVLNAFGFTKSTLLNQILAGLISLISYKLLIDEFGFYGAAWGRVAAPLFVFLIGIAQLVLLKPQIKKMRNEEK